MKTERQSAGKGSWLDRRFRKDGLVSRRAKLRWRLQKRVFSLFMLPMLLMFPLHLISPPLAEGGMCLAGTGYFAHTLLCARDGACLGLYSHLFEKKQGRWEFWFGIGFDFLIAIFLLLLGAGSLLRHTW
ncbi:MAG: hypothetical protein LBC18_14510 [Opitutaceae bacterium]|jgi:hypothetical protein|nr:hypothetical protein [Opitutaceae bacterium]